jgi:hypothetical protein
MGTAASKAASTILSHGLSTRKFFTAGPEIAHLICSDICEGNDTNNGIMAWMR